MLLAANGLIGCLVLVVPLEWLLEACTGCARLARMKALAIWFCILSVIVLGQSPSENPDKMTRLVVRFQSPDVPEHTFAAQAKTIYRAGNRYCRVEEMPDVERGIHGLLVVNEPDAWFVNLAAKSARHVIDSGTKQNCHLPLFGKREDVNPATDAEKGLETLEFGRELPYFKDSRVAPVAGPMLFGKHTQVYIIEKPDSRLQLFTSGIPERPLAVARKHAGKQEFYFYDSFDEIPFEARLFSKPEGINIENAK